MDDELGLAQARTQLADLVGRVTYGGARIVLTKHGKPAAALVSMDDLERIRDATPAVTPLHTQTCDIQGSPRTSMAGHHRRQEARGMVAGGRP